MNLVDAERVSDKLRNAFTIDLLATAQKVIEDAANNRGITLVHAYKAEDAAPTYEEKSKTWIARNWPFLALGALFAVTLVRR